MFVLELQVLPVLRRSPEGSGAPMDFAAISWCPALCGSAKHFFILGLHSAILDMNSPWIVQRVIAYMMWPLFLVSLFLNHQNRYRSWILPWCKTQPPSVSNFRRSTQRQQQLHMPSRPFAAFPLTPQTPGSQYSRDMSHTRGPFLLNTVNPLSQTSQPEDRGHQERQQNQCLSAIWQSFESTSARSSCFFWSNRVDQQ